MQLHNTNPFLVGEKIKWPDVGETTATTKAKRVKLQVTYYYLIFQLFIVIMIVEGIQRGGYEEKNGTESIIMVLFPLQ